MERVELTDEHDHAKPLVQTGPTHGQHVNGPGQQAHVRRGEQLDGHGRGHEAHDSEKHRLVRPIGRPDGPRCRLRREQAHKPAQPNRGA